MTLLEFKAWFEGFTEGIDKAPTLKQWARIKARVKEIDGTSIPYPVYVDRWVTPYQPYNWQFNTNTTADNTTGVNLNMFTVAGRIEAQEMKGDSHVC